MNLIIIERQNEEINAKKIIAVKDATYAVAKTKPEKKYCPLFERKVSTICGILLATC